MCEFCVRHGEGKKWYEVMQNYSAELYAASGRENYIKQFVKNSQTTYVENFNKMLKLKHKRPSLYKYFSKIGSRVMKYNHFGQIVPLEDAEMIIDMVQSITRIPCVCRSALTGRKNARYCFALGFDPAGMFDDYPDLQAGLETISRLEAKKLLRDFDLEGLIHSIWTFKTPYIGAICNCDRDCLAYMAQVENELMQLMFKSEYIAKIDYMNCTGCRHCQRLCQFGAIEYSLMEQKCCVNSRKCYGCGVCRSSCKKAAIELEDKSSLPEADRLW